MNRLILLLLLFTTAAECETYTINTKIQKIRTISEFNPTAAARGYVPFKVEGALAGGCTWLYLTSDAKELYSLLLAAKLSEKPVGIQYSDSPSPWHTATCQVHHLDLD